MCKTNVLHMLGARVESIVSAWAGRRGGAGAPATDPSPSTDPRVAACALLLEVAYADGEFTDDERSHVEATVAEQFGLDACEAKRLVEAADHARSGAAQVWHFTGAMRDYSHGQKALLAEILHATADLDGAATTQEAYALRKINSLLRVKPAYEAVPA
jgi:uncharacterized tellurite resistance protein B-like protein